MSVEADPVETRLPDPLVDRAVRLFSFLGQAQQLKNPRVTDLDSYRRDGAVHWLHDVPDHDAVHLSPRNGAAAPSDPVLVVERVRRRDPPAPEAGLAGWVQGVLDDPRREPRLLDERLLPDPDVDGSDPGGPPPLRRVHSADLPEVGARFAAFTRLWRDWAEADLRDEPVRTFYGALFSTFVAADGHPEELELVLGTGLLTWRPEGHDAVRRHLLVTALSIVFDEATGRLTVAPGDAIDRTRVELEMLDPGLVGDAQRVNAVRETARDTLVHPLDTDHVAQLARRLVHLLSPDAEYRDEDEPGAPAGRPVASFAPAVVLRTRSQQGLVEICRRIVAQITESGVVPDGVRPLVDPDHTPTVADAGVDGRSDGALVEVDDEPFLPLPVNDVQLRILRQVDTHAQTLIQGPPGTGKTHTAAVLISHLLAQGKRVLVTAQTDRALKEVRSKLPAPIRPLAVSVVGASREDMSDLRVAVERIASAAADYDAVASRHHVEAHLAALDELRRTRAAARHGLLRAREREIHTHDLPGYRGTLADIARGRDEDRGRHEWIEAFAEGNDGRAPLTDDEVTTWLGLLQDEEVRIDEAAARGRLVDPDQIPTPEQLTDRVTTETRTAAAVTGLGVLPTHPAFTGVARLTSSDRHALARQLQGLAAELHALGRRREPWVDEALDDVLHDRQQLWIARRAALGQLVEQARPVVSGLGPATDVTVAGDAAHLVAPARGLLEHLQAGGGVKLDAAGTPRIGTFAARAVKNAAALFERVRVDGTAPVTTSQVDAFLLWVEGTRLLGALDRAWPAGVTIPAEDTLAERLQWHVTELGLLDRLLAFGAAVQQENRRLAAVGLPVPRWAEPQALDDYAALPHATIVVAEAAEAVRPLDELVRLLSDGEHRSDTDAVVGRLADAVRSRDLTAYAAAHGRLVRLHDVRAQVQRRDDLTDRLSAAAPDLAKAVAADPDHPAWIGRLRAFTAAWA